MPCIHLIEKHGFIRPLPSSDGESESGYWHLAQDTADALVGGEIYFHKKQSEPSFYGGHILGFSAPTEGAYTGRIVFRFRFDRVCKEVSAGRGGWSMEMKIVP
jgi:hypothetical protein